MYPFSLELLFHIIGIGSASGIIYQDHSLFLISDNGGYLYEYQMETQILEKTKLFDNPILENIPKKTKPDLEALVHFGDDYYIFGSGSTENRNKMFQYNSKTKTTKTIDLTDLYLSMQSFGNIKADDFNIEGVAFNGETWYFFQRGNDGSGKNGLFTVQGKNLENDFSLLFNSYKLPKIKGVQVSFTDAVLVNNKLYFLATAENTKSTYDDGEILGSLIGSINLETMKVDFTQKITDKHKFEGLTIFQTSENKMELLLCEDNDTDLQEAAIYKLTLSR